MPGILPYNVVNEGQSVPAWPKLGLQEVSKCWKICEIWAGKGEQGE